MFIKCLLGSIVIHILIIAVVGMGLPGPSFFINKTEFFELVSPSSENQAPVSKGIKPASHRSETKPDPSKKEQADFRYQTTTDFNRQISENREIDNPINENNETTNQALPVEIEVENQGDQNKESGINSGVVDNHSFKSPTTAAAPDEPSDLSENINFKSPQPIYQPEPVYPVTARQNNWEGMVTVKAEIDKDGKIGVVELLKSSGYALLDRSAIKTVRKWRYKPATRQGEPVASYRRITIIFKLED